MTEGDRIRELRKSLGLTLKEFAKPLGITSATASRAETGAINVSTQLRTAICRSYRVNEQWLKEGTGAMHSVDIDIEIENVVKKYGLDSEDAKILKNYVELDAPARKRILAYILALTRLYKDPEDK